MISDQSPRLRHQLAEKNVLARINVGDFKITAQIGFKYHKKRGLSRGWLDPKSTA
jgi:flagellar hook-length control protein FliK